MSWGLDDAHGVSKGFPALASVSAAKIIIFSLSAALLASLPLGKAWLWAVERQEVDSSSAPATVLLPDPGMRADAARLSASVFSSVKWKS